MKCKELPLLPLFERFIRDTEKGRRLKADGAKIKPQTLRNYRYIQRYLTEYETLSGKTLRVTQITGNNKTSFLQEKKYWNKFYLGFTDYLYTKKRCHDNYVGTIMKIIRVFFNYLNKNLGIKVGDFHKSFYVCKEDIPVITLLPSRLQFLINDSEFDRQLPSPLKKSKDILVFGCTVALRVSDLFNIQFRDIIEYDGTYYLPVKTIKTGTEVRIKLPHYAIGIVDRFKAKAKKRKHVFPPIPLVRFNAHLKQIAERAGWTDDIGKHRNKRGAAIEEKLGETKQRFRFCDLVSSHIMRRTAITTMLMMGMKEHIVKQISGHSNDSRSFYRYVNLAQSYMDNEMDMVFNKLANAG